MSLGHDNVKIGVKQGEETLYLSEVSFIGEEEVKYRLDDEGQVYPNSEATVLLPMLRKIDPETEFLVEGVDTE